MDLLGKIASAFIKTILKFAMIVGGGLAAFILSLFCFFQGHLVWGALLLMVTVFCALWFWRGK